MFVPSPRHGVTFCKTKVYGLGTAHHNAELIDNDAMGKMTIKAHLESSGYGRSDYIKSDQDQSGDGTVPEVSGADSASKAKFSSKMTGYNHQGSYSNKWVKDVTTYSVARIAKDA